MEKAVYTASNGKVIYFRCKKCGKAKTRLIDLIEHNNSKHSGKKLKYAEYEVQLNADGEPDFSTLNKCKKSKRK